VTGFLGRYEYQLDEKGRVSLPADYRRKAEGTRFILVQWENTNLTLFPENVWGEVKERLLALRRERPDMARLLRDVTSRATDVEPDKQGRILIPAWFKERIRLDGAVLLIGAMDRIEIWEPETFRTLHPDEVEADAERAVELHRIFG
jgi:MraZ protein